MDFSLQTPPAAVAVVAVVAAVAVVAVVAVVAASDAVGCDDDDKVFSIVLLPEEVRLVIEVEITTSELWSSRSR